MPHIIVEYSANISEKLAIPELLRKLHDNVTNHDIDSYKIKSRGIELTNYIIGDENMHTNMVHVTCLLLAGRPDPFSANLSKDLLTELQTHIQTKDIQKCSASVEVRDMDADKYSK